MDIKPFISLDSTLSQLTNKLCCNYNIKYFDNKSLISFIKSKTSNQIISTYITNYNNNNNLNGLISNHIYFILNSELIKIDDKQIQFILLYNPWGYGTWQGNWSKSSNNYEKYSKILESYCELYIENNEDCDPSVYQLYSDGLFLMCIEDYMKIFTDVNIYYNNVVLNSNNSNNCLKIQSIMNLYLNLYSFYLY